MRFFDRFFIRENLAGPLTNGLNETKGIMAFSGILVDFFL